MNCKVCGKPKTEFGIAYSFKEVYQHYCMCQLEFKRIISLPEDMVENIATQEDLVETMKHIGNLMT